MRALPFVVAAAILAMAPAAARAQEAVYPRVYTYQDCRDFDKQIDDSIRFANLDGATAAVLQMQRARADEQCFGGQYAVGARQLRDVLDSVIAAGTRSPPVPLAPASVPAQPGPGGVVTAFPSGSWREGCMGVSLDNGILRAECLDSRGQYAPSELDLGPCRQPVSNRDGHLTCGETPPGRPAVVSSSMGSTSATNGGMPGAPAAGAPSVTVGTVAPPPQQQPQAVPMVLAPPPQQQQQQPAPAAPMVVEPAPQAPDSSAPGALPPGNWIATCRNARMIGSILQSECQDRIGMWRLTAIDTRGCHQPIANRNGGLSCY
jgi:hypothetical protein